MQQIIFGVLSESVKLLYQMSPYLLFGFLIAGVMHVFISLDWIARHLGRSSVGSVIKSVILGIPLPLCSCGVIPAAVLLNRKGASRGAVISFLIATPITGVDSILATYSLMGLFFTIFRIAAASITALVAGLLSNLFLTAEHKPLALESKAAEAMAHSCTGHCCSHPSHAKAHEKKGPARKMFELFSYAYGELLGDIWRWLVLGLIIAGVISYLVPDVIIERYLGSNFTSMIAMLIIGIPMYVCATGSLPIAAALMFKGMSPGAAMVFLLAGPATNAVTITVVSKELGKGAAVLYVGTIAAMSIISGYVLNSLWYSSGMSVHMMGHQAMMPHWVEAASAFILTVLILIAAARDLLNRKGK